MNGLARDLLKPLAIVVGIVGAGALVWWLYGDKLKSIGNAVNPASDQNLAYRGVNAVGGAVTGQKDFALGSFIYDLFHEDANLASDRRAREILDERKQLENRGG